MNHHPIPVSVLEQHLVALGKTGSGKSIMLCGLYERLLDLEKRVCIIDPKGDHFGVKLSADGKSAGYPVVAFGNFKEPNATDISINSKSGARIGELVATGNRPCVIGFRGWMPSQMHEFWIDFASELFAKNKSPLYLFIDEVHNFAPKGKILSPQVGLCLHWTNRIASEGRGNGLRIMMASQRPQKVHNDTLTCAETLVAMRVTHPSDREAFHEWLKEYSNDNERGKMVLNSLATMQKGEAFVWSPEVEFFERVKFPMIKTFDSFAAPKEGVQKQLKGWATIDKEQLEIELKSLVEQQKENDPVNLRREIAELRKKIEKHQMKDTLAPTVDPAPMIQAVRADYEERHRIMVKKMLAELNNYSSSLDDVEAKVTEIKSSIQRTEKELHKSLEEKLQVKIPSKLHRQELKDTLPPKESSSNNSTVVNRIMDALAWWQAYGVQTPYREAVAFVAGYSPSSSYFINGLSACRTQGFIEYPTSETAKLTESGNYGLFSREIPDFRTLALKIDKVIDTVHSRIFQALLSKGSESIERSELAELSGYSADSSYYINGLSRLRSLKLIEYPSSTTAKLAGWLIELRKKG